MPRYEYKDAKSSKFWTIERTADGYSVCYGKLGTEGRTQSKEFPDSEKADKEYAKAVASKIKKGYALVSDASGPEADDANVEEAEEEATDGRPKGVPAAAVMADNGYEWELAERNAKGEYHGVVVWWRLDGTRCCRTEYVNGDPKSYQRFHENGQVSREGSFKNGKLAGLERFHRSSEKTTEHFAVYSAGRRVWTAEVDHDKGVRRFFDKKGEPCDQKGKKIKAKPKAVVTKELPEHWRAPKKSEASQEWSPATFETELRDGVYFTDGLRSIIFPRQGGIETSVRPLPDVDVAWAALRRAMWACDSSILAHEQSKDEGARSLIWKSVRSEDAADRAWGERLLSVDHRDVPIEEDIDFARRLFQRYRGACVSGVYSVATYERVADYLVVTRGLGEAAVVLMKGVDSELPYQRMASFERLRDLLAVASAEEYTAAKARIMEGFAEAFTAAHQRSYVGRLPAHLAWVRSFLLPLRKDSGADEREAADQALLACKGRGFGNDDLNAGGLASVDIAGLERFLETNPKVRHEFFIGGARIYLASLLDYVGVAAAPLLSKMKLASPFADSASENDRWAFILAHFDSDEALAALHDEHKAGYAWGAQGLALANEFQSARVEALLKKRGDTELLAALADTTPLGLPPLQQGDADADGAPTDYVPDTPKRPIVRAFRVETPFESDWSEEERDDALGYLNRIEWGGEPLSAETVGAWVEHRERWAIPTRAACFTIKWREYDERLDALGYSFNTASWNLGTAALMAGEGAMGLMSAMLQESLEGALRWAQPFAHSSLAPPILIGFTGKKYKGECRAWILRHPRCAWAVAIDMALAGQAKKKLTKAEKTEQSAGIRALRYLATQGYRQAILTDAATIQQEDAVREILDVDPLTLPKAKVPKLPAFAKPEKLPPLVRKSGEVLSEGEYEALLVRLAVSNVDEVHPAVLSAQQTLTPESAAAMSWALFEAWLDGGADSKQGWAMQALGFLGDDEAARKLCALAKHWPGQKASARAQAALDVLLSLGSEAALVNMNLLAEKSKYSAFKLAAAERIALIARKRGLSREALQDRLVPTLALEEDHGAKLDFGPRHFVVTFDEGLRPVLHDGAGKKLKNLPKPNKSDDAALAKVAKARFSGLKKDAKASASVQLSRLERAMTSQRAIERDVFEEHFVAHPWMSHLTRRLVWAVGVEGSGAEGSGEGASAQTFRVSEDGTFADADDENVDLKGATEVRIAHPLQMSAVLDKWGEVFGDYELLQPFAQLQRTTFAAKTAEARLAMLKEFEGSEVTYGALRSLTKSGWRPWADSWIDSYSQSLPGNVSVELNFEPGYSPAGDEYEDQSIVSLGFAGASDLTALSAIDFSELVRSMRSITN